MRTPATTSRESSGARFGNRAAAATAGLVVAVVIVATLGAASVGPARSYDGPAHLAYAQVLADGRLPTEAETYEFASPPGFHWLAVQVHRATGAWTAAQGISVLACAGLVIVGWLLARELWPGRPGRWPAAAAIAAGLPIVIRLGTMFHPEALFAFLAALATLLVVRAERRAWPLRYAAAAGAVLGAAALTRQTAAAVALALALAVVLSARRRALPFLAVGLGALALTAGPWWGYQGGRYGNPLQSNLERYILEGGQPRAFYVSAPLEDLALRPYRPHFAGELWPQFHADLWSDWFGGQHDYWHDRPEGITRVFLSAQSLLGLLFTPVALAGLWFLRRRPALWLPVLVAWIAFVVQLIRFPQAGGDPIKSSYMLFLAPTFAVAAVEAGGRLPRGPVLAWAGLYALSYAGFLATSW